MMISSILLNIYIIVIKNSMGPVVKPGVYQRANQRRAGAWLEFVLIFYFFLTKSRVYKAVQVQIFGILIF